MIQFTSKYFFPVKIIPIGIPLKCNNKTISDGKLIIQSSLLESTNIKSVSKIIKIFSI